MSANHGGNLGAESLPAIWAMSEAPKKGALAKTRDVQYMEAQEFSHRLYWGYTGQYIYIVGPHHIAGQAPP